MTTIHGTSCCTSSAIAETPKDPARELSFHAPVGGAQVKKPESSPQSRPHFAYDVRVFLGWEAVMRSILVLGVFGLVGCESDSGVKVFNASPEANITSHEDGAEIKEATEILFRGAGADPDHAQTELEGSWQLGADVLCDWAPLDEDGVNECTVTATVELTEITFIVRDPSGDGASSYNLRQRRAAAPP